MSAGSFEAAEAAVLGWLLDRKEVGAALELAQTQTEEEAIAALVQAVQGFLGKPGAGAEDGFALPEAAADAARKRSLPPGVARAVAATAAKRPRAAGEPQGQLDWLAQSQEALEAGAAAREEGAAPAEPQAAEAGGAAPLYWKIDLPDISKVLAQKGLLPATFAPVTNPHATLLYLGGSETDGVAAKGANLPLDQFRGMRETLEALDGEELEVKMTEIIIEENVACAVVMLPPTVPCANKVPHVTLGTRRGIPPRYANEVLEDVLAGRKEGVTSIQLPVPRPLKGRVMLEYAGLGDGS